MSDTFNDTAHAVAEMEACKQEFYRLHRMIQEAEPGHDSLNVMDEADVVYAKWREAAYALWEIRRR